MKIINLMEDTEGASGCLYEHGLSFYAETKTHRYLFDFGASDKTLVNACTLGIDLTTVDTAVLSHGHYDHSGGILAFSRINPQASIYMMVSAGEKHVHRIKDQMKDIGIDSQIRDLPQVHLLNGNCRLNNELNLFSGVQARRFPARGNKSLLREKDGTFVPDDFSHEMYAILQADGRRILFSGCAHNGIVNILEHCRRLYGWYPDMVIGGFHMILNHYRDEDIEMIEQVGKTLKQLPTVFYTGHCTGEQAVEILKQTLGEQLQVIRCGSRII